MLDADSVTLVLAFLDDARDVARAAQVARVWRDAAADQRLWQRLCAAHWLATRCEPGADWRATYVHHHHAWRRYGPHYHRVKRAWVRLEAHLAEHCPPLLATLNAGCAEAELDAFEGTIGARLPLDLRCALRIHNGQTLDWTLSEAVNVPGRISPWWGGIFGGTLVYDQRTSLSFRGLRERSWTGKVCGGVACSFAVQYPEGIVHLAAVCLSDQRSTLPWGAIVTLGQRGQRFDSGFVIAPSFASFFEDHVSKICDGHYTIVPPQPNSELFMGIDRHAFSHGAPAYDGVIYGSESVTDGLHIRVNTSFNGSGFISPSRITLNFSYKITIWLEDGPHRSVQLVSRHWRIHGADGTETPVDGPGVIGYYPTLQPGQTFSYVSRTNFDYPISETEDHLPADLQEGGRMTLLEREGVTLPYGVNWPSRTGLGFVSSRLVGVMHGWFTFIYINAAEAASRPTMRHPHGNEQRLDGDFNASIAPFRLVSPAAYLNLL